MMISEELVIWSIALRFCPDLFRLADGRAGGFTLSAPKLMRWGIISNGSVYRVKALANVYLRIELKGATVRLHS